MNFDIASAALWVFPLLLALVCHEWAHGYAAYRLGDDTAERAGRLTINPIAHIDPIGSILMPGLLFVTGAPFLFGYAKPVPVAFQNLRNPARDMVLVAAAGPAMNVALAILCVFALAMMPTSALYGAMGYVRTSGPETFDVATPLAIMCTRGLLINVVLALFNMIPIPPLDGGRVAVGLLPRHLGHRLAELEPYGLLIVFALLFTGALDLVLRPVLGAVFSVLGSLI